MNKYFDDRTMMRCLHHYHSYYLFEEAGEAVVIRKWTSRKKENDGEIMEERGGINGEHMTPAARLEMRDAWNAWLKNRNALSA